MGMLVFEKAENVHAAMPSNVREGYQKKRIFFFSLVSEIVIFLVSSNFWTFSEEVFSLFHFQSAVC